LQSGDLPAGRLPARWSARGWLAGQLTGRQITDAQLADRSPATRRAALAGRLPAEVAAGWSARWPDGDGIPVAASDEKERRSFVVDASWWAVTGTWTFQRNQQLD